MSSTVVMRAQVPRELRKRAKMAFAEREITFSDWFREHLEQWIQAETEAGQGDAVHH